jgi:hypothetical protein
MEGLRPKNLVGELAESSNDTWLGASGAIVKLQDEIPDPEDDIDDDYDDETDEDHDDAYASKYESLGIKQTLLEIRKQEAAGGELSEIPQNYEQRQNKKRSKTKRLVSAFRLV